MTWIGLLFSPYNSPFAQSEKDIIGALFCLFTLCLHFFQKNFMWNTVTIQYNPLIEEEWDEHFKVTCEYGYDFWKTVTFPFLDVE